MKKPCNIDNVYWKPTHEKLSSPIFSYKCYKVIGNAYIIYPNTKIFNVILLRVAHLKPRQPVKGLPCPLWTTRGLEVKHVLWTIIVHKLDSLPWESHLLGFPGCVCLDCLAGGSPWCMSICIPPKRFRITTPSHPKNKHRYGFMRSLLSEYFFVTILSKKRMVRVSNSWAIFCRWVAMTHPLGPGVPTKQTEKRLDNLIDGVDWWCWFLLEMIMSIPGHDAGSITLLHVYTPFLVNHHAIPKCIRNFS